MGDRRNRRSLWDTVEETKHPSGMSERDSWSGKERHSRHSTGRYHEFSSSGTTPAPTSADHSGWPSWESIEGNPISDSFIRSRPNVSEGKEIGGENRHYKNVSPGFDGMERRNYNHPLENDHNHPHRYLGRGRSRSPSRSRTRGRSRSRSRSRSLSRGKGRERGRAWSRSRSRSRSDDSAKGRTRSRSPPGDYRRQSYGWGERRSGPDKSSQICRDFASGRCRRGKQCRFFHPDNISRRDEDLVEDDGADTWRYRADHGRISKQSYSRGHGFEFQDDVSDPHHGDDVQFQNKRRSAAPCKDFMRGNCRWGDNCKFSHQFTSDNSFGKGTGLASFDEDNENQPNKIVKPLCKYFAAGKCDRDNCRFSHEDPKLTNLEGRRSEVADNPSFHDKSNRWNGPRRDDVTRFSDTVKPTQGSEAVVTNRAGTNDATDGNVDDRRDRNFESERWEMPEWTGNSLIREPRHAPLREMGSYGGGIGNIESIDKDNISNEQEHVILPHRQLNQDGTSKVQGQNTIVEDQTFSMKTLQQNVCPASQFQQQHHGMVENNVVNSFGATVVDEVDSRISRLPIIFSGQNLNQNRESMFSGHPSSLKGTDRGGVNMLIPNRSNGFNTDLNEPEINAVAPLDFPAQMQNNPEAVQPPAMSDLNAPPFPYSVTSDHSAVTKSPVAITGQQVAPATNPTVFLTQRFVNEQSQTHTGVEVSHCKGMMPSFPNMSDHVPFVSVSNAQPNSDTVSLGLLNALDNDGDKHRNHNLTGGTEPTSQMHVDQSSIPSIVGVESGNLKVKHPENPELKQEDLIADSEVNKGNEAIGEESKGIQENKGPSLDGHGKVEDSSDNKDNKGMRLFKNALIELVKELLKPKWKEGRMSREVHKTIVKKVVDKVTTTIQVDHIPKTQDKVEQYLSNSKPKVAKLVQAYVERCQKTDS